MADQGIFSVPALFIVFREVLEASIVCAVLLGVLKKTGMTHLNKFVWVGIVLGLIFTGLVLVATLAAFSAATAGITESGEGSSTNATQTDEEREEAEHGSPAELRLKAGLTFSAAIMIAGMCWTLGDILKKQGEIEKEILQNADRAIEDTKAVTWKTIFFLTFTAVAREGVETVIFLGVGSGFQADSLPLPIAVGLVTGSFGGYLLYKAGSKLALTWFFRISVIFLAFVGAGIFAHGFEELSHLGVLGWWGVVVYNISYCCGLRFPQYALFRAVFGYTPYPTRAEMFAYFMYWLVIIVGFLIKWFFERRGISPSKIAKFHMKKAFYKATGNEEALTKLIEDEKKTKEEVEKEVVEDIDEVKEHEKVSKDTKASPAVSEEPTSV